MQRLTIFAKTLLFLTAYIPLGILLLVVDFKEWKVPFFEHSIYALVIILVMLVSIVGTLLLILILRNRPTGWEKYKVISAKNMDQEIVAYIFTYILPFLGFPDEKRIPITLFLLIIIGVLYIRSDLIGINPFLAILGFHIHKVGWKKDEWPKEKEVIILSKFDHNKIIETDIIDGLQIQNEIFLVKGIGRND